MPTQPLNRPVVPRGPSRLDGPGAKSVTLPPPDWLTGDQGDPAHALPIDFYPYVTVVNAVATGIVTETGGYPGWPVNSWGPAGRSPGDAAAVWIQSRYTAGYQAFGFSTATPWAGSTAASVSAYIKVFGTASTYRSGAGAGAKTDYNFRCGPPASGYPTPCYTYSGSGTVSLERVESNLLLTADSTEVNAGSTVTFSISQTTPVVANSATDSIALPLDGVKTIWIPDDSLRGGLPSEVPDSSTACSFTNLGLTACLRVVRGSGTLTYIAIVNGLQQQKSIHVIAKSPLTLAASPQSVSTPNGNITFTASAIGPLVVQSWSFRPDSQLPVVSGSWGACQPGVAVCTNLVSLSGTVTVAGTVGGVNARASVHVNVMPCPTGDDLLDDPKVRKAMDDIALLSKATDPNIDIRLEYGFSVFDSSGVRVIRISPKDAESTPCHNSGYIASPPGILLAQFHIHPFPPGDSLPAKCVEDMIDDGKIPPAPPNYWGAAAGPSIADWDRNASINRPVYVFDKKSIYRITPGAARPEDPITHKYHLSKSEKDAHLTSWPRTQSGCSIVNNL